MSISVEFCGGRVEVPVDRAFYIGREGDLRVDDNPFLHRHFLMLSNNSGVWMLANVGDQLAATVSDVDGRLEAYLGPGATLPLVFEHTVIRFTAGPTSYEMTVQQPAPMFRASPPEIRSSPNGATTVGRVALTPDQQLLILALAESALRSAGGASAVLPSSQHAAMSLGWTTTKFNRKLDNVCDKLTKLGVRGLHGRDGELASNRRARLVEYALAVRLVTADDLALLDRRRVSS